MISTPDPLTRWRTRQRDRDRRRKLARDAFRGIVYMLAVVGLAAVGQLCSGCATFEPERADCPYDVGCMESTR